MNALAEAERLFEPLVTWRRDLHRHPELGFQEYRTAALVAKTLRHLGYTVQESVAHTGVVGLLKNGDGPVVMNRVDMDALPIQEANHVPYASQTPGVMHACGHDAHVALGLGIATVMAQQRNAWRGTLKLIFQPGEEGMNGAEVMVNEGVLENPRPAAMLATHVWNDLPIGVIAATPGPIMAAAEEWDAVITGHGGHAAAPDQTTDPITTAALAITALQTIVSRNVSPLDTAVVTVGMLRAGETFNVIPNTAELRGTIRTFSPSVRETAVRRVQEIISGTAKMMGAQATVKLHTLTPAVSNAPQITQLVQQVIRDLLGAQALRDDVRTMGSEDAAFLMREIPGCYIFVGSAPRFGQAPPHHNPHFDIQERAMVHAVAIITETLCRLMPPEQRTVSNSNQPP